MALSRLKAHASVTATRTFTDREAPLEAFVSALDSYLSGEIDLRVLTYYGVGGIGKTRLLKVLEDAVKDYESRPPLQVASLRLDSPRIATPAEALFDLRRQLDIDCTVFDFALARHWANEGMGLDEIRRRGIKPDSLLYDLVEAAAEMSGMFVPTGLLRRLWAKSEDTFVRRVGPHSEDLAELEGMDDAEVSLHLPFFLGNAMAHAFRETGQRFVVFADGHESMVKRFSAQTSKREADFWLSETAGCAETGLYVIGGREYVRWDERNPEWGDYLEQHILGRLSESDADAFLSGIPIDDSSIRESIIETAAGVPLYLDMCASMYLIRLHEGLQLSRSDFDLAEEQLVERFLNHLDKPQTESVKAASLLEAFDQDLFAALVKGLNIGFPVTLFPEFCSSSYTAEVDSQRGLFKIHDVVRAHTAGSISPSIVSQVISIVIGHLEQSVQSGLMDRAEMVFRVACDLIAGWDDSLETHDLLDLVASGMRLIDSGRWNAVLHSIQTLPTSGNDPEVLRVALALLKGRCARKRGDLQEAKGLMEAEAPNLTLLGPLAYRYRFHDSHITHLLGDYASAADDYESLIADSPRSEETLGAQALAARQLADVRFIQGKFRSALSDFGDLASSSVADSLWASDLFRFRGHIHRFNFLLVDAESLYERALEAADAAHSAAMRGKVLTNLGETLCWSAPTRAGYFIEEALELNGDVQARIEVGKALSASAIANAMVGELDAAETAANTALQLQRETGYKSGEIFAGVAAGLVQVASSDVLSARNTLEWLHRSVDELGVYHFALLPLEVAVGGGATAYEVAHEWLDWERTLEATAVAVAPIRSQASANGG